MNEQSKQNKTAWEYRAYEFWCNRDGTPVEKAEKILENPEKHLKKHKEYFNQFEGIKIANLCGSNGRRAVPLSVLGADVTVFDISEENKRYALELAEAANTSINYIVGDIYDINLNRYTKNFDILYLEGGILHYFNNINHLMFILFSLLHDGGKMILGDFHPIRKCIGNEGVNDYFNQRIQTGDLAYKNFFSENEQNDFPDVCLRFYTLSEIINSVIDAGFILQRFDEHQSLNNRNIPFEFTIVATKG